MKAILTYDYKNGKVKIEGSNPNGMSPKFREYFEELKGIYQKCMDKFTEEGKAEKRVPQGKLEFELSLQKIE